jgi:hypothetical protein
MKTSLQVNKRGLGKLVAVQQLCLEISVRPNNPFLEFTHSVLDAELKVGRKVLEF